MAPDNGFSKDATPTPHRMKRLLHLLLVLPLVLAACTRGGAPSTSNASLTAAIPIAPNNLNPILQLSSTEAFFSDMLFPKLVGIDLKHEQVPWLATVVPTQRNGGISADGMTITYHLNPKAMWSDGQPVTSADVKFTFDAIMNPNNNVVSRHGWDQIASVDTPDAHTVVVHLKKPFPPIIDEFFGESDAPYGILPKHVLASYKNLNQIPFNSEPNVTCGPYIFAEWVRGDHISLTANTKYYLGAPKIARITVKIIPDANTMNAQLQTGEVQAGIELTGPSYHNLAGDARVARLAVDAPDYDDVVFNTEHAPLDDRNVRVALAYATDRETIMRNNEFGDASLGVGDLSPFYWAYDPTIKAQPFDPAKARAILQADGWIPGPDGIRRKNGQRLSLLFVYGQGSDIARNVIVEIQQMWKNVGVAIEPKSYSYAQLYAAPSAGGIFQSGKFDVGFYAWISGADPDDSSQWLSDQAAPHGNNVARYRSPAMDAAQALALSTYDRATRKRAYAKIQQLLVDDVPAIFLFYPKQRYAFAPTLQNFHPNGISEGWNANTWTFSASP